MIQIQEPHPQQRKYFALIEKVGSWHKYQFVMFIIMALITVIEAQVIFMLPFLLHQYSYTCPNLIGQSCTAFVCKLNQIDRTAYLTKTSPIYSLADQLGNFRCQKSNELVTVQSLNFLGAVVGMTLFALFTEKFGRKNSVLSAMAISFVGMLLIFFSPNIHVLAVGVFTTFAGIQNATQYTYCYGSQIVAEQRRILYVNLLSIFSGIGMMMNIFTFYSIGNWKTIFLFFYIIPTVFVILGIAYFIQKTPIDLLATQNTQQITNALNRIATMNGVQNSNINTEEIEMLRQEYHQQSKNHFFSFFDLCKFKSLRDITIPLFIANFLANYLFFSPSFIQKSVKQTYIDKLTPGITNIISGVLLQHIFLVMHRKKINLILCYLIVVFSAIMLLSFVQSHVFLKSLVFFFYRLTLATQSNVIFLIDFQSYPTQIRASASIACYIFGELSGVVQPWVIAIVERAKIPLNYTYIILGIASVIITHWLKQTFRCPPPEIIDQFKHQVPIPHVLNRPSINKS